MKQPGERLRVGRRPGDDRLAPQHAHDIVHLSRLEQLALPRVPDGVVRRRAIQLIQRVRHLALVIGVRVHGSVHPVRKCRQRAVIRITQAEVERQLAPREHFVQERVALFGRRVGAHGAHDVEWRYHPVVEIRRESARAAIVRGIAPPFRIIEQAVADEPVQLRARMRQSALRGHRAHVMIDLAAGDFRGDVTVRDVQPLDTQRGEERGRHAALGRPIVDRLDGEFHQLGDLGPNGASGVLLLVERGGRNDAHRIHGEHSTVHPSREALRPFSHPGGGEEIGHHERRARREAIEHSAIVIQSAAQREAIRQPQRCRADRQLPRTLHDEGVEARRRVGIAGVEPLMDQQRLAHTVRFDRREPKPPVVFEPLGALHPVEHEFAFGLQALLVERQRAQGNLIAHVRGTERMLHEGLERAKEGVGSRQNGPRVTSRAVVRLVDSVGWPARFVSVTAAPHECGAVAVWRLKCATKRNVSRTEAGAGL